VFQALLGAHVLKRSCDLSEELGGRGLLNGVGVADVDDDVDAFEN
jgi:hypothetical protein